MIVLWILLFLLSLILAVGGCLFFRACYKWKKIPWLDREAISRTEYVKYADSIFECASFLQENNARDVWTTSQDGLKLHALWLEANDPIGTIILVHGYHSTYLVDFGRAVGLYHRLGLNVLLPDQRCHGKSEGTFVTFGVKESQDILCWISYVSDKLWSGKIVLSGLSMGASTVMYVAGNSTLPKNVCGIIADCGFTSPAEIIGKVFKDVLHISPIPWIYGAEFFARCFAGFSLWEQNSIRTMANNKLPVFMAHGLADDFVPCDMTVKSYEVCNSEKELLLVESAGHGVSFLKEKEKYKEAVFRLLKKTLGEAYELRNH